MTKQLVLTLVTLIILPIRLPHALDVSDLKFWWRSVDPAIQNQAFRQVEIEKTRFNSLFSLHLEDSNLILSRVFNWPSVMLANILGSNTGDIAFESKIQNISLSMSQSDLDEVSYFRYALVFLLYQDKLRLNGQKEANIYQLMDDVNRNLKYYFIDILGGIFSQKDQFDSDDGANFQNYSAIFNEYLDMLNDGAIKYLYPWRKKIKINLEKKDVRKNINLFSKSRNGSRQIKIERQYKYSPITLETTKTYYNEIVGLDIDADDFAVKIETSLAKVHSIRTNNPLECVLLFERIRSVKELLDNF